MTLIDRSRLGGIVKEVLSGQIYLRQRQMGEEQILSGVDTELEDKGLKISRLAIMSMVFAVLGPCLFGAMWVVSFLSFYDLVMASPCVMTVFSCGITWVIGLVLGIKSLGQIKESRGQLVGRGYAIAGIVISAVWMVLVFAGLLLPAIYYVNS